MKRSCLLFLCLTISGVSVGQDKPTSVAVVSEIPPGPSMEETTTWISRQLPVMGSDYVVTSKGKSRWRTKYEIESAVLSECRLTLRISSHTVFETGNPAQPKSNTATVVPLKDVDVSKLQSREVSVGPGYTRSKRIFDVPLVAMPDRGEPFTSERIGISAGIVKKSMRETSVRVYDPDMANQVAKVLRRAAVLCGAPNQSVVTAGAEPVKKREISPTNPESPTNSKMTNDEVIQLVTAGLSEQVIITSIRQAPIEDFDLTPTGLIALKKAGVSDAVIVVMQEKGTPVQAPSPNESKTPPKTDGATTSGAAQAKPGANRKLSQESAEKAIRSLASTYGFDLRGGGNGCSFKVQSIARIELSQFSETEATADVLLKCARGGLLMKFVFRKDIDNHWFLTQIAGTSSGYQVDSDAIAAFRDLKVPAQ